MKVACEWLLAEVDGLYIIVTISITNGQVCLSLNSSIVRLMLPKSILIGSTVCRIAAGALIVIGTRCAFVST